MNTLHVFTHASMHGRMLGQINTHAQVTQADNIRKKVPPKEVFFIAPRKNMI